MQAKFPAPHAPRATSMVERFHEIKRCGFLWLTTKTRTVEVINTFEPLVTQAGESGVPDPMRLEEQCLAPWAHV